MSFKYRKQTESSVKAQAEQSGGKFASMFVEGIPEFRPKKGTETTIRIAPPSWGDDDNPPDNYADTVYVNFGIGPDDEGFISRSKMGLDDDPVREMHDRMRRHGDEYAEQIKRQLPKKRRPMYVYVRGEEETGWQAWGAPWTVHRDIGKAAISKRRRTVKFIDDPDNGYDVTISRDSGEFGKYTIDEIDPDPSPIDSDPKRQKELLDWLEENPLPDQYRIYSYDEIKRRCDGDEAADSDGDTDDDPQDQSPMQTRGSRRAEATQESAATTPDEEDDPVPPLNDDEDAPIDEDDIPFDSAPPPAPKSRGRKAAKAKTGGVRKGARTKD